MDNKKFHGIVETGTRNGKKEYTIIVVVKVPFIKGQIKNAVELIDRKRYKALYMALYK